jgi:hypothetical protein
MDILIYTIKSIAYALTEPYWMIFLAFICLMLYNKNKRVTYMQKLVIGESNDSPFELTISQIVIGIFAGVAASLILSYTGIIFDENSAIDLVFLTSIVFMFFNPRFICFSYSGAALGITSLLLRQAAYTFNNPGLDFLKIDIAALMSMVAILHFVEGFLVLIDGRRGYVPVFSIRGKQIIGGFVMNRYWLLPITIFLMLQGQDASGIGARVLMPNWWPLAGNSIPVEVLKTAVISLVPFYGMIGYQSITFTQTVKEKSRRSGLYIIIYSIVLFGFAQLAVINVFFQVLVLAFAPAAHELMINLQVSNEKNKPPKYVSSDEGIMVLDIAKNSPAVDMGIGTGDLLVEVNGRKIENEDDILNAVTEMYGFISFKVKKASGIIQEVKHSRIGNDRKLGIVFVPRKIPKDSTILKVNNNKFQDILDKIKNKNKDE